MNEVGAFSALFWGLVAVSVALQGSAFAGGAAIRAARFSRPELLPRISRIDADT